MEDPVDAVHSNTPAASVRCLTPLRSLLFVLPSLALRPRFTDLRFGMKFEDVAEEVDDAEDGLADMSTSSSHSMKSVLGKRGVKDLSGHSDAKLVGGDEEDTQTWFRAFAHGFDILAQPRREAATESASVSAKAVIKVSGDEDHPDFFRLSARFKQGASAPRAPFSVIQPQLDAPAVEEPDVHASSGQGIHVEDRKPLLSRPVVDGREAHSDVEDLKPHLPSGFDEHSVVHDVKPVLVGADVKPGLQGSRWDDEDRRPLPADRCELEHGEPVARTLVYLFFEGLVLIRFRVRPETAKLELSPPVRTPQEERQPFFDEQEDSPWPEENSQWPDGVEPRYEVTHFLEEEEEPEPVERGLGYDPLFGDYVGRRRDEEAEAMATVSKLAADSQNFADTDLRRAVQLPRDEEEADRYLASQEQEVNRQVVQFYESDAGSSTPRVPRAEQFAVESAQSRARQRQWLEDRQEEAALKVEERRVATIVVLEWDIDKALPLRLKCVTCPRLNMTTSAAERHLTLPRHIMSLLPPTELEDDSFDLRTNAPAAAFPAQGGDDGPAAQRMQCEDAGDAMVQDENILPSSALPPRQSAPPGFSIGSVEYTAGELLTQHMDKMGASFERMFLGFGGDISDGEVEAEDSEDVGEDELGLDQERRRAEAELEATYQGTSAVKPGERSTPEFYPFKDEKDLWAFILTCSPRYRISRNLRENIWMAMEGCGVTGMPSRELMEEKLAFLRRHVGALPVESTGHLGNKVFVNDMRKIVEQELCNPLVREHLRMVPEDTGKALPEVWAAEKWAKELPAELLTQAVVVREQLFYVNEVTPYNDGQNGDQLFFPVKWITKGNSDGVQVVHSRGYLVEMHPSTGQLCIDYRRELFVSSAHFTGTGQQFRKHRLKTTDAQDDIIDCFRSADGTGEILADLGFDLLPAYQHHRKPSRRRDSKGRRVVVPLILYGDDSSGNRSKKWNKHVSFYTCLAGLPAKMLAQEYNIHFLSTSNVASPLEQIEGIVTQINSTQTSPIAVVDIDPSNPSGTLDVEIMALLFEGDNPMHAELSCQKGMGGLKFCRCCHVGASKKADERLASHIEGFMKTGPPRDLQETKETLEAFRRDVANGASKSRVQDAEKRTGTSDLFTSHYLSKLWELKEQLTAKGVPAEHIAARLVAAESSPEFQSNGFRMNPLLDLKGTNREARDVVGAQLTPLYAGYDFHRDTPVEILHTILLGFVKYLWRDLVNRSTEEQKQLLRIRLRAFDTTGCDFSTLDGDMLVRFANSLVGKDFRAVLQSILFTVTGSIPQAELDLWRSLAVLGQLVWRKEIEDIEAYLLELQIAIDNFMDCTAMLTPQWFNKKKWHILLHLPEHIRRFGPATHFATEKFESYNGVMREQSVHSNRQAPGRDIAVTFGKYNMMRHILSGGWWTSSENLQVRAGPRVRELFEKHERVRKLYGLNSKPLRPTGSATFAKLATVVKLNEEHEFTKNLDPPDAIVAKHRLKSYQGLEVKGLTIESGEVVKIRDYVFVRTAGTSRPQIAQIESMQALRLQWTPALLKSSEARQAAPVAIFIRPLQFSGHSCPATSLYRFTKSNIRYMFFTNGNESQIIGRANVQHDCLHAGCRGDATEFIRQERQVTTRTRAILRHRHGTTETPNSFDVNDYFLLNTTCTHNHLFLDPWIQQLPPLTHRRQEIILEAVEQRESSRIAGVASTHAKSLPQFGDDGFNPLRLIYREPTFVATSLKNKTMEAILLKYMPNGKFRSGCNKTELARLWALYVTDKTIDTEDTEAADNRKELESDAE
ncbi:hypothetical protein P7C70_g3636, partial [Phenoliferia sp. Uapishka_3]